MRQRMNKLVGRPTKPMVGGMGDKSGKPMFDNAAVGRAFSEVSYREHKKPISVRGTGGNTVSFKPRSPEQVGKDFAASIRNKRRRERSGD